MAAVCSGKPIDTTMAFTPTAGLVMGTRPGDLDPGLLIYLMKDQKLSADDMDKFISQQCGLLGVSETSSDMRDLLAVRTTDPRAADAVELFCYQAKKYLCALTFDSRRFRHHSLCRRHRGTCSGDPRCHL